MSKETVSPKSMIAQGKKKELSQDGDGFLCDLMRTASWQALHKDRNM